MARPVQCSRIVTDFGRALTDDGFERGLDFIRRVGLTCTASHNEVVLLADVLGLSTLVKVLNKLRDAHFADLRRRRRVSGFRRCIWRDARSGPRV
ncbi:hypothetical protein M3I54_28025 [Paraburkholderia sp. CNPSo 3274]|uniref:dioxygenase n=1 Tax=Paraburkholderia sp. CNPSo 3274 TaxID=2940932 RepID=UPI0020B6386B|nr:dioxygenase [Paraburkholderia sp. CNPSo 3274]MCP3710776.1 hypothetical protein [Paraburkholderia sp. CNPSo 3274]